MEKNKNLPRFICFRGLKSILAKAAGTELFIYYYIKIYKVYYFRNIF